MHKPNDFWKAYIGRFWYFYVQYVSGANFSFVSGLWQNSVTAPYCRDWEPRYPQTHPSASDFHFHIGTPRHPLDIPQTPPRHLQGARDVNRRQQTPPDVLKQHLSVSLGVWGCLFVSGGVCCCLLASPAPWRCLGGIWGFLVGVWGYLSDIWGNWRNLDVFGGIWILTENLSPCSMEPHHCFGTTLKCTTCFHLTIRRHQNIKMSIYKLNKNG